MAIRINTVEYGWESNKTTVSGSVVYTSPTKSIWVVETGSRTFVSADLHLYVRDGISGTTIPGRAMHTSSIGLWIDNNYFTRSFWAVNANSSLPPASDHFNLKYVTDFANHFNTYFTGAQHNVQFTYQTPTGALSTAFTQHTGKLYLTYQYDDIGLQLGTKTIRIPITGTPDYVSSTQTQSLGYSWMTASSAWRNIPALDTYLPETNKNYTSLFFEIHSKDASNATTAVSMSMMLDSGSENIRHVFSSSLNTAVYSYDIWDVSGTMSTNSSHVLKTRSSLPTRFANTSPILNVSYIYDYSASSRIMNSLILTPQTTHEIAKPTGQLGSNLHRYVVQQIFIIEPNPVMKQSALVFSANVGTAGATGIYHISASNGILNFTNRQGSTDSGPNIFNLNFSSESIGRSWSFNTLQRGQNNLTFKYGDGVQTTGGEMWTFFTILNYESDNITPGKHTKTIYLNSTGSTPGSNIALTPIPLPLTTRKTLHPDLTSSYFIHNLSSCMDISGQTSVTAITTYIDYTGSYGSGSIEIFKNYNSDSKLCNIFISNLTNRYYKLWPTQPETINSYKIPYFNSRISREFFISNFSPYIFARYDFVTVSHNTNYVSCSLQNCNFSGSTYDVYFYLSGSNDSPINVLSLDGVSANKSGSFDWYDNFQNIYAVCYTPEYGVSNMLTAGSGSHTINFAATSTTGEKSYTFIG